MKVSLKKLKADFYHLNQIKTKNIVPGIKLLDHSYQILEIPTVI